MAPEFLNSKGNHVRFTKLLFQRTFIYYTKMFPLILYNLAFIFKSLTERWETWQNCVEKVIGKVLINLLHHAKFITSCKASHLCNHRYYITMVWRIYVATIYGVISKIINVPAVAYTCCLFQQAFWFLQLPYCVNMLLLTSACKSLPAQY